LGDKKQPGVSLFSNFETLLEELGIKIEFSNGEIEGKQDHSEDEDDDEVMSEIGNAAAPRVRTADRNHARSRRASFNSIRDVEEASAREILFRPRSRASMSQLQSREPTLELGRPSTRATTRPTEKTRPHSLSTQNLPTQPSGNRLTAEEFASNLQHYQRRHASDHRRPSQSARVKAATAKPHGFVNENSTLPAIDTADNVDPNTMGDFHKPESPYVVDQQALFYRPSDTQLMRDVKTFQYYRTHQVARALFEEWCGSAFRARNAHRSIWQQATSYDTNTLLRSGFEHWRACCRRKRLAADTERFFSQQEHKMSRDRDLYLLRKAFTHWAECSSEIKTRIDQARKRLLELKYFNAWLDMTTVNALKVRRQQLSKAFKVWRHRVVQNSAYNTRAMLLYNHRLAKTAYWSWFWTFCETRAPVWRDNRMKKKLFSLWETKQQQLVQWDQRIIDERSYRIAKRHFSTWLAKVRGYNRDSVTACSFKRSNVISQILVVWRRRTYHAPLIRQVSNMVDWRVAGTTFALVVARYRTEQQAVVVTQSRVVRNAWTTWNDQLRQQTLIRRIDDRIVVEALYRWVIQERNILLARLHQERIQRQALLSLVEHWSDRKGHRDAAARATKTAANRTLLASTVKHWRSKMNNYSRDKRLASMLHAPRIMQEALQSWTARNAHLQKLHTWGKDAEFYFLATKLIKRRWHGAMIEVKRQKRRDGYAQVRRTVKMDLATRLLHQWRNMAAHTRHLLEEARLRDKGRLLHLGSEIFDNWRNRADLRLARDDQAEQYYYAKLTAQHLELWSGRAEKQWRMADLANLNGRLRIQGITSQWLQKLRLRMIEVTRGPEANAQSLKLFHEKRRFHNVFRRWQAKTATSLHRPVQNPALFSRARQPGFPYGADNADDAVSHIAERDYDEGFDQEEWILSMRAHTNATPLHGHLSTPSKRAAWAKARVEPSTTPVGTPLQHRLRSKLATEPRSARRKQLSRTTTLRDSAFAAILEAPPRTPLRG